MTASPINPAGRAEVREALDAEIRSDISVDALRLAFDGITALLNTRLPPIATRHDGLAFAPGSSATLDVLVPAGPGPHPVLVYLHGGAWVAGSPASHRKLTARFVEAGFLVLSVDYRLAPEHPFPAGFDDCLAAVHWAAAHARRFGGDPERLTLGGDSAGANLAAAVAVALAGRRRTPRVRALALIYGVFDMRDMGSASANRSIHRAYLPGEPEAWLNDPRVSPIHAAHLLPPSFVIVGGQDPLVEQSRRLRRIVEQAGTRHAYMEAAGMPHGFMQMEFLGGVRKRVTEIAAFLDREACPIGPAPTWRQRLGTAWRRWLPRRRRSPQHRFEDNASFTPK